MLQWPPFSLFSFTTAHCVTQTAVSPLWAMPACLHYVATPWTMHRLLGSPLFASSGLSSFLFLVCKEAFLFCFLELTLDEGSHSSFWGLWVTLFLLSFNTGKGEKREWEAWSWNLGLDAGDGHMPSHCFWIHDPIFLQALLLSLLSFPVFSLMVICFQGLRYFH